MANIIPPRVSFVPTERKGQPPGSPSVNGTVARHNLTRKAIPPPDDPSVSTSEVNSSNSDYDGWKTPILQGSLGVAGFVVFVVVVLAMWRLVGNPKKMMRKAVGVRKKERMRPDTIENFLRIYHTMPMPEEGKEEEPQTPCNTPSGPLASSSSQTDYCMFWMPAPPHMQANNVASPVLAFDGGYIANMAYREQSFNSPDTSPQSQEPVLPRQNPSETSSDKIEPVAVKAKQSESVMIAAGSSRQDVGQHPEPVLLRQKPSQTSSEPVAIKARPSQAVVGAHTSQQDVGHNEGKSKHHKSITTTEIKISTEVSETDAAENVAPKATVFEVQASVESDETPVNEKGQSKDENDTPVDDQVLVIPSTSKEQLKSKEPNPPKTPAHHPRAEQVVSEITVPLEQISIESKQKMENPKEETEDESEAVKTDSLLEEQGKVLVAPPYCSSVDTPRRTAEKACQTPEAKRPDDVPKKDAKTLMISNSSGPESASGIENKPPAKTDDSTLAPLLLDNNQLTKNVQHTDDAKAPPLLPPRKVRAIPSTNTTQVEEAPKGIVQEEEKDKTLKGELAKRSDLRPGGVDSPESAGLQSRRLIEKKHPEYEFSSTLL